MSHPLKKVELLAPAGTPEKLEIAIHYGADAVYLADNRFSLRNFAGNFTRDQLKAAADLARKHGVKLYVACNIYARTDETEALCEYFHRLSAIGPDGIIIADPGVLKLARAILPHIPVHLSTQANTTSLEAVRFWEQQGVSRINLARELTLTEIAQIASQTSVQIETFVHGSMCMAYSGRCLLSGFLTGRESNRGLCSHPCRWHYSLAEKTRPGAWMPANRCPARSSIPFPGEDPSGPTIGPGYGRGEKQVVRRRRRRNFDRRRAGTAVHGARHF